MVRTAVLASGSGSNFENLVSASRAGRASGYSIQLLIVDKPAAYAVERAKKLGIQCYALNPKEFESKAHYEREIVRILSENEIEIVALAGYMRIIADTFLTAYKGKIVNIHPAYLPEFPGKDGIGDAFKAGAEHTGVTVHYVDEGVDTGEIIYQERLKIEKDWDLDKLKEEVHKIEHKIYPMTLEKICQKMREEI